MCPIYHSKDDVGDVVVAWVPWCAVNKKKGNKEVLVH